MEAQQLETFNTIGWATRFGASRVFVAPSSLLLEDEFTRMSGPPPTNGCANIGLGEPKLREIQS
jgi:hypothetical protein